MFNHLDRDGDGTVSIDEFAESFGFVQTRDGTYRARMRRASEFAPGDELNLKTLNPKP
jgi:hypothetical protein